MITESHTDVQSTLLVRHDGPLVDPSWNVSDVSLEDLALAYIGRDKSKKKHGFPAPQKLKVAS